jgi:hypothetical protein
MREENLLLKRFDPKPTRTHVTTAPNTQGEKLLSFDVSWVSRFAPRLLSALNQMDSQTAL